MDRQLRSFVERRLTQFPAVVLLGPRQVGKTTLARAIADGLGKGVIYLDLESNPDRNKLADADSYFSQHSDKLIVLDEIHRMPEIFATLRGQIDQRRRDGREAGHFLILGSAAIELMRQSSESLAGRAVQIEMTAIQPQELPDHGPTIDKLWERGGFPRSVLATDQESSLVWRTAFIRSYLERDIPQFGFRIPAETLRRFWTMLAHAQGGILNAQKLAQSLGADWHSVMHYLDLMCDLLLVRRLPPWGREQRKRLVKAPKVYVRDSGLLHSLLGLSDIEAVLSHPVAGLSWEGFVIEALIAAARDKAQAFNYRTASGAELDLVLEFTTGKCWAIEIKKSSVPQVGKGFTVSANDIGAERRIVVHKGAETYPLRDGIEAMALLDAVAAVEAQ